MLTRSQAAIKAIHDARHPQANQAFKEGLGSVFRQWTALNLAIQNQWGGPNTQEKADALIIEVFEMFMGPEKIYKDDVALVLEDHLDVDFSMNCEDGSPDEISGILVRMWKQCGEGDFNLVTNTLGQEFVTHEALSKSEGLDGGDAMDSDDEGDEDCPTLGALVEMDDEDDMQDGAIVEPPTSVFKVDPDGWETIVKGKKSATKKITAAAAVAIEMAADITI